MQAIQASVQAVLQQTPDTQKPLAHSALLWQPGSSGRAQLPFMHCLPTHWASLVQVEKQEPVAGLQVYGTQMMVGPGLQVPAPSHARDPTTAASMHVPLPQSVPAT